MSRTYQWIHRVWYEGGGGGWVLLPLSWLYSLVIAIRRWLYRRGILGSSRASVPVIVVGNVTAGGTGKTPVVIWLVDVLREAGFSPGIASRGYGGSHSGRSMRVDVDSDASVVGDEPALLARRTRCPVAVDSDRVRACEMLVEDGVDVVVTDDGLQHYRLQRDFEICVIDGARGLGNRRMLPAGPLREPASRLEELDHVLINGESFELHAGDAVRVNGSLQRPLENFRDTTVHAVAGIGNPGRFFDLLRSHGVQVIEHPQPDHAELSKDALQFGDEFDVLVTEKDAVKLDVGMPDRFWYVPVDTIVDDEVAAELKTKLITRLGGNSDD